MCSINSIIVGHIKFNIVAAVFFLVLIKKCYNQEALGFHLYL